MRRRRGFTLIELVMVITILGILAVIAIPKFIDLREDAQDAAKAGISAAVESGAQIYKARRIIQGATDKYYPVEWYDCLDTDVTSDIDSKYTVNYTSTTGQVSSIEKK